MRRLATFLLLLAAPALVAVARQGGETTRLTILHWNDFHAQNTPWVVRPQGAAPETVGGAALLAGMIDSIRAGRRDVAVFNAGDDFQGSPISSMTSGRSQVAIMNRIAPTAVTLGNHEFDYGIDSLRAAFAVTSFPVVVSNVVREDDGRAFALAYEVRDVGDLRLGIVGAVPADLPALTFARNIAGYRVRDIDSSLDLYVPILRHDRHADLVILVSHMGLGDDTLLAARRNDIDVIVGGHSHTALAAPIRKGRTIVVQAGSQGRWLGRLDLTVDREADSVVAYDGRLLPTRPGAARPDSAVAALVASYEERVNAMLGERIGTLAADWDRKEGAAVEINIGDFVSEVTRAATGADVAFQNVGGIRKDLAAGPVTVRDIWEIHPFGNTYVTFRVTGAELRRMLDAQAVVRGRDFAQVAGLRYAYDATRPAGGRIVALSVAGHEVADTAVYTVATNNYIGSHLREFFGMAEPAGGVHDTGIVDRDAVIAAVRATGRIDPRTDGRIEDRSPTKVQRP